VIFSVEGLLGVRFLRMLDRVKSLPIRISYHLSIAVSGTTRASFYMFWFAGDKRSMDILGARLRWTTMDHSTGERSVFLQVL
jgi:hypothetical protein